MTTLMGAERGLDTAAAPPRPKTMMAVLQDRYGSADVLRLAEIAVPEVLPDRVLLRVRAASVNSLDWRTMRGEPRLFRKAMGGLRAPKNRVRGVDVAGTVVAVGSQVTRFVPGDEVFGSTVGAFAEYARARETSLQPKPQRLSFEEAATLNVAGHTALQGLRDGGRVRAGQRVLIYGAGGGVGTFAVQIAKALGAHVTAASTTRKLELLRSIGADEVIDYTHDDFSRQGRPYDVIFDIVGDRSIGDYRRALTPTGTLVIIGGSGGRWLGPVVHMLKAIAVRRFVSQRLVPFISSTNPEDLAEIRELAESGKLRPVIDRRYPLSEAPAAVRYLEEHNATGKVVITVS
ncbi:MAG TPA: NAD(P)-dependent alcohol dehydrogenase [Candidatus Limnocylindria bacterium]|jgi:NADPH:quinone reductase-like Zn-dependent oxidoreductase